MCGGYPHAEVSIQTMIPTYGSKSSVYVIVIHINQLWASHIQTSDSKESCLPRLAEILATACRTVPFLSLYVFGNIGFLSQAVLCLYLGSVIYINTKELAVGHMHSCLLEGSNLNGDLGRIRVHRELQVKSRPCRHGEQGLLRGLPDGLKLKS
jgi:hypothetical protein